MSDDMNLEVAQCNAYRWTTQTEPREHSQDVNLHWGWTKTFPGAPLLQRMVWTCSDSWGCNSSL